LQPAYAHSTTAASIRLKLGAIGIMQSGHG
jgi:hypothetical protein